MANNLELKIYNDKNFKIERTNNDDFDGGHGEGIQYIISIGDSIYEASVIKKYGSYGYEEDLWELAFKKLDRTLVDLGLLWGLYDDVIGWLTEEKVNEYLEKFYKELVSKGII